MTSEQHPTPEPATTPVPTDGTPCRGCGTGPSRRTVMRRAALAGAVGVVGTVGLAACTDEIRAEENASSHHVGGTPTQALPLADLPTGSMTSVTLEGRTLLLSRPTPDEVHAFSAVCTHQGCTVATGEENGEQVFSCPCHGSHFDPTTGAPYAGPAKKPLTGYTAVIEDDWVLVTL